MGRLLYASLCLALLIPASVAQTAEPSAIEVKLIPCDTLFLAPVTVEGKLHLFLLDTGATSILDLGTFANLENASSRSGVDVTSWSRRDPVEGRIVRVKVLQFGGRELRDLHLAAINLSMLSTACGKKVDGVLGADILEKLGALIDMSARVAKFSPRPLEVFADARREFLECVEFFNRGDPSHFRHHLDEAVVWFTPFEEVRGQDAVIRFLKETYFDKHAHLSVRRLDPANLHIAGDSYWLDYEYEVQTDDRAYHARGTAFSYRKDGEWKMTTVHNSIAVGETAKETRQFEIPVQ